MPNKRRSQSAPDSDGNRPGGERHLQPNPAGQSSADLGATPTRQAFEAEIALYRHALERAREDFKAFAYSVSHDLRAPLRAIEGFSKILLEDFASELSPEPRGYLNHVIANSQTLGRLLDDLLKFYRVSKDAPTKIPVDADRICKEALSALDGLSTKASIEQQKLPIVQADPVQLREIFSQLLANALKFSANSQCPKIEIGSRSEPGAITFFVRDNGVGFNPKKAERLFQVFQKMHSPEEFGGNGIGLAIVKRLVEAHGGCITADAEPDKGAVFCFALPNGADRVVSPPHCAAVASAT